MYQNWQNWTSSVPYGMPVGQMQPYLQQGLSSNMMGWQNQQQYQRYPGQWQGVNPVMGVGGVGMSTAVNMEPQRPQYPSTIASTTSTAPTGTGSTSSVAAQPPEPHSLADGTAGKQDNTTSDTDTLASTTATSAEVKDDSAAPANAGGEKEKTESPEEAARLDQLKQQAQQWQAQQAHQAQWQQYQYQYHQQVYQQYQQPQPQPQPTPVQPSVQQSQLTAPPPPPPPPPPPAEQSDTQQQSQQQTPTSQAQALPNLQQPPPPPQQPPPTSTQLQQPPPPQAQLQPSQLQLQPPPPPQQPLPTSQPSQTIQPPPPPAVPNQPPPSLQSHQYQYPTQDSQQPYYQSYTEQNKGIQYPHITYNKPPPSSSSSSFSTQQPPPVQSYNTQHNQYQKNVATYKQADMTQQFQQPPPPTQYQSQQPPYNVQQSYQHPYPPSNYSHPPPPPPTQQPPYQQQSHEPPHQQYRQHSRQQSRQHSRHQSHQRSQFSQSPQASQTKMPPGPSSSGGGQQEVDVEAIFERQFREMDKQFDEWRERNKYNPDRAACQQYEYQYQQMREQLLQKREHMRLLKEQARKAKLQTQESSQDSTSDNFAVAGNTATNDKWQKSPKETLDKEETEESYQQESKTNQRSNANENTSQFGRNFNNRNPPYGRSRFSGPNDQRNYNQRSQGSFWNQRESQSGYGDDDNRNYYEDEFGNAEQFDSASRTGPNKNFEMEQDSKPEDDAGLQQKVSGDSLRDKQSSDAGAEDQRYGKSADMNRTLFPHEMKGFMNQDRQTEDSMKEKLAVNTDQSKETSSDRFPRGNDGEMQGSFPDAKAPESQENKMENLISGTKPSEQQMSEEDFLTIFPVRKQNIDEDLIATSLELNAQIRPLTTEEQELLKNTCKNLQELEVLYQQQEQLDHLTKLQELVKSGKKLPEELGLNQSVKEPNETMDFTADQSKDINQFDREDRGGWQGYGFGRGNEFGSGRGRGEQFGFGRGRGDDFRSGRGRGDEFGSRRGRDERGFGRGPDEQGFGLGRDEQGFGRGRDEQGFGRGRDEQGFGRGRDEQGFGRGRDEQGFGRGRDEQGFGRGRDEQGFGRGRDEQGFGRGRDQQGFGRGRDQQGFGRGRDQQGFGRGRDDREFGFGDKSQEFGDMLRDEKPSYGMEREEYGFGADKGDNFGFNRGRGDGRGFSSGRGMDRGNSRGRGNDRGSRFGRGRGENRWDRSSGQYSDQGFDSKRDGYGTDMGRDDDFSFSSNRGYGMGRDDNFSMDRDTESRFDSGRNEGFGFGSGKDDFGRDKGFSSGKDDFGRDKGFGSGKDNFGRDKGFGSGKDDFGRDKGFGSGKDDFGRDKGFGSGKDDFVRDKGFGSGKDDFGRDKGFGSGKDDFGRDKGFGSGKDDFGRDKGFGSGKDDFGRDKGFGSGKDDFSRDKGFGSGKDDFSRDKGFGSGKDDFSRDKGFGSGKDDFSRDKGFGSGKDDFGRDKGFGSGKDNFGRDKGFGSGKDDFGRDKGFGSGKDDFGREKGYGFDAPKSDDYNFAMQQDEHKFGAEGDRNTSYGFDKMDVDQDFTENDNENEFGMNRGFSQKDRGKGKGNRGRGGFERGGRGGSDRNRSQDRNRGSDSDRDGMNRSRNDKGKGHDRRGRNDGFSRGQNRNENWHQDRFQDYSGNDDWENSYYEEEDMSRWRGYDDNRYRHDYQEKEWQQHDESLPVREPYRKNDDGFALRDRRGFADQENMFPRQNSRDARLEDPKRDNAVSFDYGHRSVTVQKDYQHCSPVAPTAGQRAPSSLFASGQIKTIDYGHGQTSNKSEVVIDYGHERPEGDTSWTKPEPTTYDYLHDAKSQPIRETGITPLLERDLEKERMPERDRGKERDRDLDRDKDRSRSRDDSRDDRDRDRDRIRDDIPKPREFKLFPAVDPKYGDAPYHRNEPKPETILIEDLLCMPGRKNRPSRIVIILRGPPGAGKTFVAKLIKDKEMENGGNAPRMLCLDDYFMVETEKMQKDPESGKQIKAKVLEYEYEPEMEKVYQTSLVKVFKKTIENGFFPFIIVDAINDKCSKFEEMWSFAKQNGIQVYIAELDMDATVCHKRNTHGRSLSDITKIIKKWEQTPRHYLRVDIRSLLQDAAIPEVEMEDFVEEKEDKQKQESKLATVKPVETTDHETGLVLSRWEKMETTDEKLDKLDGLRSMKKRRDEPQSLEDYLQLPDDYEQRSSQPGKKRVRWADVEEQKVQDHRRALGFVIGQTDWDKITDPLHAERALTKTKYI